MACSQGKHLLNPEGAKPAKHVKEAVKPAKPTRFPVDAREVFALEWEIRN